MQRRVIEEACEDLGFTIVQWYEGIESGSTRKRPILDRLLADAETNKWDGVMVYDATRGAATPRKPKKPKRTYRNAARRSTSGGNSSTRASRARSSPGAC